MSIDSPLDSDLVQDSRLPTKFLPDGETKHTIWRSDKTGRRRRSRKDEIWRREPGRQIGSGSFGQVWLERSSTGRVRALKAIRKEPQFSAMSYARELEAAAKFSHDRYVDCFVKSYGWFEDEKKIYIAMEYLQHGDLGKHIDKEISESEAQDITCQLVQGLNHLHDNKFVHRDLKPQNILVVQPGPTWWVKIADLGLSKRVRENIDASSAAIGTERYCAPEVLRVTAESSPNEEPLEQSHKAARDLWALGEVVFQILAKRPAFSSNYEVYRFAEGHETLERQLDSLRDRDLSVECLAFVEKLLVPDPRSRVTAAEAVLDPWLLSVELSSPLTSRSSTPTTQESPPSRMLPSNPTVDTEANVFEGTRKGSCQWSTGLLDGAADTSEVPVSLKPRPLTSDQRSRGHDNLERHSSGDGGPSPPRLQVAKRNSQPLVIGATAKFAERVECDWYANRDGDRRDRDSRDLNHGHHLGCEPATRPVSQGLDVRRTDKSGGDLAQGRLETGEQRQQIPRRSRSVSILNTNADQDGARPLLSHVGTRSIVAATISSARPDPGELEQAYYPSNWPAQASARPLGARTHSDDKQLHVPTPEAASRSFFCAHPWCTQKNPIALYQEGYPHAFGSLIGLMQHISEYHPAFSRGGPGEFLCTYPHHGDQQAQLKTFASLRELLNHLTEFATHEQGEMGPLFSWGYLTTHWYDRSLHSYAGDYKIYVAAFPSMEHMVSGHAHQYARMAYGTTKYRVVDKKERLLVHGSQFPPPLPHAMPPSTTPSSTLIGEVYYRPPPPQPSLQRSSSARSLRSRPSASYQALSRPYLNTLPGAQRPPPPGYPPNGGILLQANQNYNQAMRANAMIRSYDYYQPTASSASLESFRAQSHRPQVLHQVDARPPTPAGSAKPGQKRGSRPSSEVKPKVHHHTKAASRVRQNGPEKGSGAPHERMQDTALKDESALRARASALQLEYEERNRQEIARVEADAKRLVRPRAKPRNTKTERRSQESPLVLRGDNFSIHLDAPEDGSSVVVTLDTDVTPNSGVRLNSGMSAT